MEVYNFGIIFGWHIYLIIAIQDNAYYAGTEIIKYTLYIPIDRDKIAE